MSYEKAYSYDDLLLVPQRSSVDSRSDVDLSTNVTPNVEIDVPLVSAPMDSVTGPELAQAMTDNGGVGIIHRFAEWRERKEWIESVDGKVGASVGIENDDVTKAVQFANAGADFICVDVAHAHLEKCLETVSDLEKCIPVDIMVGNVATRQAAKDLLNAGADSVKVGIGPGSSCITRTKTGHGVPQASAVREASSLIYFDDEDYTIVADGGIRNPGDGVKALMLGANSLMMGGIFGRCEESPSDGDVWGMASRNGNTGDFIEGIVSEGEEKYTVSDVFDRFEDGIRSGLSYSAGHTIKEARENAEFTEISLSTKERNGGFEI